MCEIAPKKMQKFTVEFYSAHDMTNDQWTERVIERILAFELMMNERGDVRCHVHHGDGTQQAVDEIFEEYHTQIQDYIKFANTGDEFDKKLMLARSETLVWAMQKLTDYLRSHPSAKV
jgi:hypothetical protein